MQSADIDLANNRLLIGDSDLDMVIAVDLDTGERTKLISNSVGEGRVMVSPFNLTLDDERQIVYIADDGGNGPEVVLAVDLTTGNRQQVGDIDNEVNVWVEDIVYDKNTNHLYVVFEQEILKIDLTTNNTTKINASLSSANTAYGYLSSAAIDADNNRLILADGQKSKLLALDLVTGNRSLVSSFDDGIGAGDAMGWISSIAIDEQAKIGYVYSVELGAVYSINLASGDRVKLFDSCHNAAGENVMASGTHSGQNLYVNAAQGTLLVIADYLMTYDITAGTCLASDIKGLFDATVTSKGQLLATSRKSLLQADLTTGETVVVSK